LPYENLASTATAINHRGEVVGNSPLFMFLPRATFPTPVHTFAQASQQNSIDDVVHKEYLPFQIEPKSLRNFTAQFRKRSSLTVAAPPD
jgi:hypothetical protein